MPDDVNAVATAIGNVADVVDTEIKDHNSPAMVINKQAAELARLRDAIATAIATGNIDELRKIAS